MGAAAGHLRRDDLAVRGVSDYPHLWVVMLDGRIIAGSTSQEDLAGWLDDRRDVHELRVFKVKPELRSDGTSVAEEYGPYALIDRWAL